MVGAKAKWLVGVIHGALLAIAPSMVQAAVRHVPGQFPTIQEAIDAANAGDEIDVRGGEYCGAVVDKPLTLIGHEKATIVGCATGPTLAGVARIGFFLPGSAGESPASGTRITGFDFDGRGVGSADLSPLAFGVVARFADNVTISQNSFFGTVQAVTNTGGDHWLVTRNRIEGLTLFDCTGALCGGGSGIVVQVADGSIAASGGPGDPVNRPEGNVIFGNEVRGTIPDGFAAFSMAGIFVLAADNTLVENNRVGIPDNPNADAAGDGILVSNSCCGDPDPIVPGSRNTVVGFNDGLESEFAVVVEGTHGANTEGLVLFANAGRVLVEGREVVGGRGGGRIGRMGSLHRHFF
jgi:nitrous oxidase accessory protein NosD